MRICGMRICVSRLTNCYFVLYLDDGAAGRASRFSQAAMLVRTAFELPDPEGEVMGVDAGVEANASDGHLLHDLLAIAYVKGKVLLTGIIGKQVALRTTSFSTFTWIGPVRIGLFCMHVASVVPTAHTALLLRMNTIVCRTYALCLALGYNDVPCHHEERRNSGK
eukprot:COSAG05_NODE_705_length_7850_cov_2.428719_7_plen_165_part_00